MFVCPRYRFVRLELFKTITKQDKMCIVYFIVTDIYLMNNENVEIIKAVMDF